MLSSPAICVSQLRHSYGSRAALRGLDFEVRRGEIFAFLGPNGGGKTTLFRVLSTLIPLQSGAVEILGYDLRRQADEVRRRIGVVFQAPSLDKKLTVAENLRHQGHLYGLSGRDLAARQESMLVRLGLVERRKELAETLSGGLRRRVELAKGMLHRPQLLLLDEPSTGLDPGVRSDLWEYLRQVRDEDGVTVVLTTHLLDEAEKADRLAIVHQGEIVALDTPEALRGGIGGDAITIRAVEPARLAADIRTRFELAPRVIDGTVRLEQPAGHTWIARLVDAFPGRFESITLAGPTLEDVFIARTGHRFWEHTPGNQN